MELCDKGVVKKMQNNEQNKPIMYIKRYEGGERFSLNYDGEIQIITLNYYNKLKREAQRAVDFENELELSKLRYLTEISKLKTEIERGQVEQQRLRNQLKEQEAKFKQEIAFIQSSREREVSDKDRELRKAKALLNRQGKGRPVKLTEQHKSLIRRNLNKLQVAGNGGAISIRDLEAWLVNNQGYTGGYEPVRAYVSELLGKK